MLLWSPVPRGFSPAIGATIRAMAMTGSEELAYRTEGEPGTGGRLKRRPEDFMVEEIPLFEPSGSGDHLYLYVEKHRRTSCGSSASTSECPGPRSATPG
jgi:hypothetical protein